MFYHIHGTVSELDANLAVIDCGGIGFAVSITMNTAASLSVGEKAKLYISESIGENNFDLYGFKTIDERNIFKKLISVKGIGPKGALAILANGDIDGLQNAIEEGDSKYLQKFPGIGPKASGQIILDLKGKLGAVTVLDPKINDVKEALKSLGYNNQELKKLDKFLVENKDLSIQELIKQSLKKLF